MSKFIKSIFTDRILIRSCIAAGAASSLGNIICQTQITNKGEPINYQRVLVFTSFGVFFTAPWFTIWRPFSRNLVLNRGFKPLQPLQQVVLDSAVSPYVLNTCLIFYKNFLEQGSLIEGWEAVKEKLPSIIAQAYMFWPFLMFISFAYVPIHYQFYFGITASVFWNIGLSYMLMQENETHKITKPNE